MCLSCLGQRQVSDFILSPKLSFLSLSLCEAGKAHVPEGTQLWLCTVF